MTPEVQETDPDGIDYGWIMQMTFILAIVLGAPAVAILSVFATLPTWTDRAVFAVRVGAVIWLVTLIGVYLYARFYRETKEEKDREQKAGSDQNSNETAAKSGSHSEQTPTGSNENPSANSEESS